MKITFNRPLPDVCASGDWYINTGGPMDELNVSFPLLVNH